MSSNANINAVFYATSYHPIQAGSIDGTDITPHDNGVYRAVLCATTGLYDPSHDPKVIGDPYRTIFVGRLSHSTTEESLKEAMNRYGQVKDLRLVRHIVTGASQGYAFVEYETEREMRHAYEAAYHSIIDGSQVIVDYSRQQLMSGWIPRRLGGGLGGRKESGQLRFGGRDRPFRAPLRPIPKDELKKLGIPLPPEGRYMSRFQTPPLPGSPSVDIRHHRQWDYRSTGLARSYGDASDTSLPDLKLDQEKLSKKLSSSRLVNEEKERGVSVAKETIGSFGGGDKAGDREGSMHADTDEGDSKSRSHHHHRHRHRSHTDRHTPHHHERKRKERSSEHKRSSSPDQTDEEKRRRWRDDKYSDHK